MNGPNIAKCNLWSEEDLFKNLDKSGHSTIVKFSQDEVNYWKFHNASKLAKEWQSWCSAQKSNVKVVDCDVPNAVLPKKMNASLADIRVQSRGPDDAVYNKNESIRLVLI